MRFFPGWSYLAGYLEIEVQGEALERFINTAVAQGILFWDVRRIGPDRLLARIRIQSFFRLRPIARQARCRVKLRVRYGLPFFIARMRRRRMLVMGGLFFLVMLYILASFIWVVNVTGIETLERQAVLEAAARHGLRTGVWRSRIDVDLLEKQLKDDFPAISFLGIHLRGSVGTIEIVEKVFPPEGEREKEPAHLMARRDGLIEDIIVFAGEAQVEPGDTVKQGQCLISGVVQTYVPDPLQIEEPPLPVDPDLPLEYVHARGWIRARVWYEGFGDAYLREENEVETGVKTQQIKLTWENKQLILWGPRAVPYAHYRQEQKEQAWPFTTGKPGDVLSSLQIKRITYYEQLKSVEEVDAEKATQKAAQRARQQIDQEILPEAVILQEKVEAIPVEDAGQVRVRIRKEALEDIAKTQYFEAANGT